MIPRNLPALLLCATTALSAFAEVPYTFTPGEAANAEEVNANFSTLVSQIEQLQEQIAGLSAAPTMASLAGTYDLFELAVKIYQNPGANFDITATRSNGTVVFNADGTGTLSVTENDRHLTVSTMTREDETVGEIETTSFQLENEPAQVDAALQWALSGNVVSVEVGGGVNSFVVGGGNMLISNDTDDAGSRYLTIAVRR